MPKKNQDEQQEQQPPRGVKLLRYLEGHKDAVLSVAFDPSGQTLASGSWDNLTSFSTSTGSLTILPPWPTCESLCSI
ncbi:MAG TPA: WD40 repeat domain-containing protein [Blastocatellia bacterium]|nr:WD40 repeat domain-containing protein [Blastocatellia bacterium]